jgi:hypothetical protein
MGPDGRKRSGDLLPLGLRLGLEFGEQLRYGFGFSHRFRFFRFRLDNRLWLGLDQRFRFGLRFGFDLDLLVAGSEARLHIEERLGFDSFRIFRQNLVHNFNNIFRNHRLDDFERRLAGNRPKCDWLGRFERLRSGCRRHRRLGRARRLQRREGSRKVDQRSRRRGRGRGRRRRRCNDDHWRRRRRYHDQRRFRHRRRGGGFPKKHRLGSCDGCLDSRLPMKVGLGGAGAVSTGAAPRQQQQSLARVPGEAVEQPQPMARAANGM